MSTDRDLPSPAPRPLPVGAVYVPAGVHYRVTAFNAAASVRLQLSGLILRSDGVTVPFRHELAVSTDRLVTSGDFIATEGWLVAAHVIASSGTPRRGQCFARLQLTWGGSTAADSLATILQGYVTDTQGLAFPGSNVTMSTEGPGVIRSVLGTDPAAGAEISETVPTNARWRLISMAATFVTDATAANRESHLTVDDGVTVMMRAPAHAVQAASTSVNWAASAYGTGTVGAGASLRLTNFPPVILGQGWRIRTSTVNIQAGDNYGAPQLLVEEWIED